MPEELLKSCLLADANPGDKANLAAATGTETETAGGGAIATAAVAAAFGVHVGVCSTSGNNYVDFEYIITNVAS